MSKRTLCPECGMDYAELEAELERLRELVQEAYFEGLSDGSDGSIILGGKTRDQAAFYWVDSRTKQALKQTESEVKSENNN